jgi:hypothetical protein
MYHTALHTDWSTVPVEQLDEGIERQMVVGDRVMICRLRFAPNIVTPAHRHEHEQMTLVNAAKCFSPSARKRGSPGPATYSTSLPIFGATRRSWTKRLC